MLSRRTLNVIEVFWSGPLSADDMLELTGPSDFGLIQVYGTHPIFGANSLLYLDAASDNPFAASIARVAHWLKDLPSAPQFYVGRLGGTQSATHTQWHLQIALARQLLEFFHSPPWNTKAVNHHGVAESTLVLNLGRRNQLLLEVSTLWDETQCDNGTEQWQPYGVTQPEESIQ